MTKNQRGKPEEASLREAWERGTPVRIERGDSKSSVLSVRISRETLKELTQAAREKGVGPTALARELIELALALDYPTNAALLARVLGRLVENVSARAVS